MLLPRRPTCKHAPVAASCGALAERMPCECAAKLRILLASLFPVLCREQKASGEFVTMQHRRHMPCAQSARLRVYVTICRFCSIDWVGKQSESCLASGSLNRCTRRYHQSQKTHGCKSSVRLSIASCTSVTWHELRPGGRGHQGLVEP